MSIATFRALASEEPGKIGDCPFAALVALHLQHPEERDRGAALAQISLLSG
ncbi:hypothetical protein G6L05_22135 [Agrobacterium rhizogenes]|nr:hypothetical protein [Rhizobium rhizogenes]